jgi:hypothetical protein
VRTHVEPPPHSAVLLAPVACMQVDWPSHVEVQPLPQVPLQLVFESQCEVQSLAQSTAQVFWCWQSKVAPDGKELVPPSPAASVHVPPALQVHVVSVQLQAPEHMPASGFARVHPTRSSAMSAARIVIG